MNRNQSKWWSQGYTAEWWDGLGPSDQEIFLEMLSDRELEEFIRDWRIWGRDSQLRPEGIWHTWLLLAGRGFGKTRTAVENTLDVIEAGEVSRCCLLGQGDLDVRDVMVEGESGILANSKSWFRPEWRPSLGRLEWPNGALAYVFSAVDPEALRGHQFDWAWVDEPMAFVPKSRDACMSNLKMGLRLGTRPRLMLTTTPKPHRYLHELLEKAKRDEHLPVEKRRIVVTKGSTHDNKRNLPGAFFEALVDDYEGTSIGRQEIYAEILGEEAGAIWTPEMLDATRVRQPRPDMLETEYREWARSFAKTCEHVVIGVDPNTTSTGSSHAAGIVPSGRRGIRRFALGDWSVKGAPPSKWAKQAVECYLFFQANEIVAEVNQGGDMVRDVIHQAAQDMGVEIPPVKMVRASKGKQRRAEPIATAYGLKRISNVGEVGHRERPGPLYLLEQQMCSLHDGYDPTGEDFDRADALVWGMTRLGIGGSVSDAGGSGMFNFDHFAAAG